MKKILLTLIMLQSLGAWARESAHVTVQGMVCAICAKSIEKTFLKEDAVKSVKVNLDEKWIHLDFKKDKDLSNEKIQKLLKDAGYEAKVESH